MGCRLSNTDMAPCPPDLSEKAGLFEALDGEGVIGFWLAGPGSVLCTQRRDTVCVHLGLFRGHYKTYRISFLAVEYRAAFL